MKTIIILMLSIINFSQASVFKGKEGELHIDLPDTYQLHQDFLGLPNVYIKTEKNKKNTTISITPTGIKYIPLEMSLLKKNYEKYQEGRKKWAKKNNFKINKFIPFTHFENASKAKISIAGFTYSQMSKEKNIEKSYFVICQKETFQLKLLTEENTESKNTIFTLENALKKSTCL